MLGKPKYKVGDTVTFFINGIQKTGEIYIIDYFGTLEDDSDVSYDIIIQDDKYIDSVNIEGKCLYKHINEKMILC